MARRLLAPLRTDPHRPRLLEYRLDGGRTFSEWVRNGYGQLLVRRVGQLTFWTWCNESSAAVVADSRRRIRTSFGYLPDSFKANRRRTRTSTMGWPQCAPSTRRAGPLRAAVHRHPSF